MQNPIDSTRVRLVSAWLATAMKRVKQCGFLVLQMALGAVATPLRQQRQQPSGSAR